MTVTTQSLVVGQQATGTDITVPVIRFQGQGRGPRTYIQANVHGAEVQGNGVIHHLVQLFKTHPPFGDVVLVPMANPLGINQKSGEFTLGRFDPVSGENWNRQYHFDPALVQQLARDMADASEQELAQALRQGIARQIEDKLASPFGVKSGQHLALRLQKMALEADIVLDLHTGPISARHLYVPEYARERAHLFNIPLNILIPSDFAGAMDEASFSPWWQLSEALAKQGRAFPVMVDAFTLELGSQEYLNVEDAYRDALGIVRYLQHRGALPKFDVPLPEMTQYACYLDDYRAVYSPCGGQIEYLATLGQPLAPGEPLARVWHFDALMTGDRESRELTLPEAVIPVLHFASASVRQGTELFKVLSHHFLL
ncbi:succinylglutamate desuccinylase/aspartoacylase family protein [Ferrimonas sediminicola]|uniref:Succinylglutamate desuccinylase/aspartoacylase family protein n=1 Tax=Ferrimonas sediminicola TaxID=2569538 RepID=A0A4U1BE09_9GAMM|nr:succinylglutamate desuccinylase/aspartoacylase family protein [Ferrimonas sediminicola]TKB48186.1 succinylglutamate desuccinylase/aspartoacylase family protein [Ferrimonas sediminicola]